VSSFLTVTVCFGAVTISPPLGRVMMPSGGPDRALYLSPFALSCYVDLLADLLCTGRSTKASKSSNPTFLEKPLGRVLGQPLQGGPNSQVHCRAGGTTEAGGHPVPRGQSALTARQRYRDTRYRDKTWTDASGRFRYGWTQILPRPKAMPRLVPVTYWQTVPEAGELRR
jgi:hypothetical protein